MRPFPKDTYQALKTATRALFGSLGKQDAAAEDLGIAQSTLSEYASPNKMDRFAPIDRILDAEKLSGMPTVTRAMAAENGYLLLAMPHVQGDGELVKGLGELAKETGEAVSAIASALAVDGDMKPEEIIRFDIPQQIEEAMERLAVMRGIALEILREAEAHHG